jgi:hypothetical protein
MSRNTYRNARRTTAAWLVAISASSALAAPPMHPTKEAHVISTARAKYTMLQEGQDVGHEHVTRTLFDNNTIRFEAETVVRTPSVTMTNRSELTLEEESYFPRSYRSTKTVKQPTEEFTHTISVEMFANVAVLASELRGTAGTQRVVVPAGTALLEVGQLYPWYQLLFWIEPQSEGRERIEWLDPATGSIQKGEIYVEGEQTIDVLGKKTKVTVYKAERERLGPAVLYVDARKRIVKAEQNMLTYRLDEWKEEPSKK